MEHLVESLYKEFLKTTRNPGRIFRIFNRHRLHHYIWRQRLRYKIGIDPKQVVVNGYDRIGEKYYEWANEVHKEKRAKYTALLLEKLPSGAEVLELGCGVGIPTTRQLAEHYIVTGVDISARCIVLAKKNVPSVKFIHADMMKLDISPESFDAITAFYSIIHIPRQEQPKLLQQIASWLRPGGFLIATMGADSTEVGFKEDWLGVPMYWSSYDSENNKLFIKEAGLKIIFSQEEIEEIFFRQVKFLWIIAQKPGQSACETVCQ